MRPSDPGLRATGLHELNRQSQPSRQECHSRELQNQPYTFWRRFGTASIFSTVFSMHSTGFLLRATELEWKSVLRKTRYYCMSFYKPKAVLAESERQYTAAGGDVQVPREVVFTSNWRSEEVDARIATANAVLRDLLRSVVTKRELSDAAKLSVFKSIFVPILTCGHESWVMTERILTQVQAPKIGFLEESTVWQRGVSRLDCAWGKKQVWCLHIWTYSGIKFPALKKSCDIVATFRRRPVIRRPGHCAPLITPQVSHFATKCAAVKFAVPWMSNKLR